MPAPLKNMEPLSSASWMRTKTMILVVIKYDRNMMVLDLSLVLFYSYISFLFFCYIKAVLRYDGELKIACIWHGIWQTYTLWNKYWHLTQLYFFVMRTLKIWSLNNFWVYNTNISAQVSTFHYRSPEVTTQSELLLTFKRPAVSVLSLLDPSHPVVRQPRVHMKIPNYRLLWQLQLVSQVTVSIIVLAW